MKEEVDRFCMIKMCLMGVIEEFCDMFEVF